MTNNYLYLNDMALFALIVHYQSFTKAALALGLAKSTVSQKLTALETKLSTRLINRTTRRINLTKAGKLLFDHCETMLHEAKLAESNLKTFQTVPSGHLRITCPEISSQLLFPDLLSAFKNRYPKVEINLIASDKYLDLIGENIDFAFRTGKLKDSSLICRKIGSIPRCLVASETYLKKNPAIIEPNDLGKHSLLKHSNLPTWNLKKSTQVRKIKLKKFSFESNSLIFLLNAALNDQGVALLPLYFCQPHLKNKKLQIVLSEWTVPENNYFILYPARNKNNLLHKLFLDYVLKSSLSTIVSVVK